LPDHQPSASWAAGRHHHAGIGQVLRRNNLKFVRDEL